MAGWNNFNGKAATLDTLQDACDEPSTRPLKRPFDEHLGSDIASHEMDLVQEMAPPSKRPVHESTNTPDDLLGRALYSSRTSPPIQGRPEFMPAQRDDTGIDWRSELCRLLGIVPNESDENIRRGTDKFFHLLQANGLFKNQQDTPPEDVKSVKPYYRILHRNKCHGQNPDRYHTIGMGGLDPEAPFITTDDGHLVGKNRAKDIKTFALSSEPGLSFIIVWEYVCCSHTSRSSTESETPKPVCEQVYYVAQALCNALSELSKLRMGETLYPDPETQTFYPDPHYWVYRERKRMEQYVRDNTAETGMHLGAFREYFTSHKQKDFDELDELLSDGKILRQYLGYLFAPGDIIAQHSNRSGRSLRNSNTFRLLDWPNIASDWRKSTSQLSVASQRLKDDVLVEFKFKDSLRGWDFDGAFQEKTHSWSFRHTCSADDPFDITALPAFPLNLGQNTLRSLIEERGRKMWACRKKKLVSYKGWDCDRRQEFITARFMIHTEAFKTMAPNHEMAKKNLKDGLTPEVMNNETPPTDNDFILLLPPFLMGYCMEEKSWFQIWASDTHDIVWNTDSFQSLVMEEKTKELIMALVTHKIALPVATDHFFGKGNGLVILLHGGPGTGKTLTAESVAEYAKKPLYRVACGDIGTRPEQIEVHLKRVLNIGKTWDCVVLLDEAEVFLQERTLHDIQRNALVSVFLRVLEYYDGILILTSNRVGLFDEGFKSRIQLSIHYENLSAEIRLKIWKNFINRLETFDTLESYDENIDINDLRKNVVKLSKYELNGREIRNVVTTARQLAMFKGKSLDFECLKDVIGVSMRFDAYLRDRVNEGLNDDDLAKEKGLR